VHISKFPVEGDVAMLCMLCREFDRISENLQSAESEIDWLRKEVKPIYSSNVQGLLRTKIEAGEDIVNLSK